MNYSINMLQFYTNHRNNFDSSLPLFYTLMKHYSSLFVEIINLLLLCTQNTVMDCVFNFVVLTSIGLIDEMAFKAIKNKRPKEYIYSKFSEIHNFKNDRELEEEGNPLINKDKERVNQLNLSEEVPVLN